ncbi:gamma-glutamyl hydrolase-like [Rhopilema esculentum]|uniref:gamma-glutamyl hydrolase-like n=1 Tax=Rhopilema esculentum TaxID=499914 RepID=UPI0031D23DA0
MGSKNKPVIGILAQEIARNVIPENIAGSAYISSVYVKFMESLGADVVPIPTDCDSEDLTKTFASINALLIPGGGASLTDSKFMRNLKFLYELAMAANDGGDYFPIWGICLGFEALLVLCEGISILTEADALNLSMPTIFTENAEKSKTFAAADERLMNLFCNEPVKYHYHKKCVEMENFLHSPGITSQYSALCYDEDRTKKCFVSLIEGRKYPFYGVQWHPEKILHDMTPGLRIPRSKEAEVASEFLGNFFINEATKNQHAFQSCDEKQRYLIQNYNEYYTGELNRIQYAYIF